MIMVSRSVLVFAGVMALVVCGVAQESPDADPLAGETATSGTTGSDLEHLQTNTPDQSSGQGFGTTEFRDTGDFLCVMCQVFMKGFKTAGMGKEYESCSHYPNKQEARACQSLWWRHWGAIRPAVVKKEDGYDICAKLVHNIDGKTKSVYCEGGKTELMEVSADPVAVTARDEARQIIHKETASEATVPHVKGHPGEHFDARLHAWVETATMTKEELPEPKHRSCADVKRWNAAAKSGHYTLWVYNEAGTYKVQREAYCEMDTLGGGWMLVRRAVPGKWHSATDKLLGTDVYGNEKDANNVASTAPFSTRFEHIHFTQYMVAYGDHSDYLVIDHADFASQWGTGACTQAPTIQESGVSKTPYQVLQCMRNDKFEDPILSTNCSQGGPFNGEPGCNAMPKGTTASVVYAEGDYKEHVDRMREHGGSNVYIR